MAPNKVEKKRKRASDRHERPSKKPALDLQSLPPLAASVIRDDSELAPVLITTPGVTSQPNIRLNPYLKNRSHASRQSTGNTGISETELLLQSSEHPKLDFVGREANDDSDSKLKHYVAVVDSAKKTWEFIEVRKVTLRGAVRKIVPTEEEEEEESEDEALQSMRGKRTELTNTFGTKKSRKATQSMAENAQLSNAPAGAATAAESAILTSMPADSARDMASKAAAVQAQVQAAKPVPTPNLDANHPSEVYPVEALVPNGTATLRQLPLTEWQQAISSGQMVQTTSRYVSNRVDVVAQANNTTQLQLLRFILVLLEFARCLRSGKGDHAKSAGPGSKRLPPREDLRRILSGASKQGPGSGTVEAASEPIPDPVIDAIRRKFAPNGSYLSKHDITFLHTTICALSLHIPPQPSGEGAAATYGGNTPNELATNIADLRDDLRLDPAGITAYFRELGCRVDKPRESELTKWGIKNKASAATHRIARLKLPLEFPRVSRGGRR